MVEQIRACTFFGHRDTPERIRTRLKEELRRAVEREGVTVFYVGNQGRFDSMVKPELLCLKKEHCEIQIVIVFAYFPNGEQGKQFEGLESVYPNGIEEVPKQFCISWRNRWMIQHSDMIIAYAARQFGGARQFTDYAKRIGKKVVNLFENNKE